MALFTIFQKDFFGASNGLILPANQLSTHPVSSIMGAASIKIWSFVVLHLIAVSMANSRKSTIYYLVDSKIA